MATFTLTAAVQAGITGTHRVQGDLAQYNSPISIGPVSGNGAENLTASTKMIHDRVSGSTVLDFTAGVLSECLNRLETFTTIHLLYFKFVSGTGAVNIGGTGTDIFSTVLRLTAADNWFLLRQNYTVDGSRYQLNITAVGLVFDYCIIGS